MKRITYIVLLFLMAGVSVPAQFERDGVPASWGLFNNDELTPSWQVLPQLDRQALITEDELQLDDRSIPFRFAWAEQTNFTTSNSGLWTNLSNGDRIWMLGIEMGNAYSLAATLKNLRIPRGGKVYIYNNDHSAYLGPLTASDNTTGYLGIPHLSGSKIMIEYYEPFAARGDGNIEVDRVAGAYRDLSGLSLSSDETCYREVNSTNSTSGTSRIASSVLLMMVDYGQRMATATLMNNSKSDATPYVITGSQCLMGAPSSWVFLFNINRFRCTDMYSCDLMALTGAAVVRNDTDQGVCLLRLAESPPPSWEVFYSGWTFGDSGQSRHAVCLHHAEALPLAISEYEGSWSEVSTDEKTFMNLRLSAEGRTFQGSCGAPLFDDEWNLIGIFTGGQSRCGTAGADQFVMLSESWSQFRTFLDPLQIVMDKIPGIYPVVPFARAGQDGVSITFYPNPARDIIHVQNDSENTILSVSIMNAAGQLVRCFKPSSNTISLAGLPEGSYFIDFVTEKDRFRHQLLVR